MMKDLGRQMKSMIQVQQVCTTLMKFPVPVPAIGMMTAMKVSAAL